MIDDLKALTIESNGYTLALCDLPQGSLISSTAQLPALSFNLVDSSLQSTVLLYNLLGNFDRPHPDHDEVRSLAQRYYSAMQECGVEFHPDFVRWNNDPLTNLTNLLRQVAYGRVKQASGTLRSEGLSLIRTLGSAWLWFGPKWEAMKKVAHRPVKEILADGEVEFFGWTHYWWMEHDHGQNEGVVFDYDCISLTEEANLVFYKVFPYMKDHVKFIWKPVITLSR